MKTIYAIERKSDEKIVYTTASRTIILTKMRDRYDRHDYRIVILG